MSVFAEPVTRAAWHDKPSWAVWGTEDKAFDPAMLRHMAERAGATIATVPGSHAVYWTQPDAVTEVVVEAAEKTAAR
jgi:pimeloyl-ACP methyl ester carboxylesterase